LSLAMVSEIVEAAEGSIVERFALRFERSSNNKM